MKYLSNFSGGACSYWALRREIERHGKENVVPIFADTLIESQDLYDFNRRVEDELQIEIVRVCVGLTPWELFRREGLIGNDRFPICSTQLKREPLNAWMDSHYSLSDNQDDFLLERGCVSLGFDWTELHRVSDFQAQWPNWRLSAPMTEHPYWDKCRIIEETVKRGFKRSLLYELGFPHDNCGGACVKAGISHFVALYYRLPVVFRRWRDEELETQGVLRERGVSNWQFTILKDRRGGTTKPLSLAELERRIISGEKFSKHDWGGCGCGGATHENKENAVLQAASESGNPVRPAIKSNIEEVSPT